MHPFLVPLLKLLRPVNVVMGVVGPGGGDVQISGHIFVHPLCSQQNHAYGSAK